MPFLFVFQVLGCVLPLWHQVAKSCLFLHIVLSPLVVFLLLILIVLLLLNLFLPYFKVRRKNKSLEAIIAERTQALEVQTDSLARQHALLVGMHQKQEILIEIGQHITADLDFSVVFEHLYQYLQAAMPVDWLLVFVYEEDNKLDFRYVIKENQKCPAFEVELWSPQDSLAGWCLLHHQPVYVANATEAAQYPPNQIPYMTEQKTASVIYQPLIIGKKTIGGMSIQAYQESAYDEQHVELIRLLAPYVAVALQNAEVFHQQQRINQALEQSKKELDYLNRLLSAVSRSLDLDVVLRTFYNIIREIFLFDGGIIQLIDEEKKELYIYTAYGNLSENILKKYKDYPLPLDSNWSATTYVVRKGKVLYTPHVSPQSKMQPFDRQVHEVYPFVSGLFIPIELNEKILGCISFLSLEKAFSLSGEEIQRIQRYVSQIAFAIQNAILYKKSQIHAQLIQAQHQQLAQVNQDLQQKNKAITDSIKYARYLQENILPHEAELADFFKEYMLFFQPKETLSGDFYWISRYYHYKLVAIGDCTGHGVPGAFMTVMGSIFLNSIMSEQQFIEPRHILTELDRRVRQVLGSKPDTEKIIETGMEIGLCLIDETRQLIQYAGANCPLLQIGTNEVVNFVSGDRMLIGIGHDNEVEKLFTSYIVPYQAGDTFYLYSDGFKDQFGGTQGKKYGGKKFREFIESIAALPLAQQHSLLQQELAAWCQATYEQVDDILVLGFRL